MNLNSLIYSHVNYSLELEHSTQIMKKYLIIGCLLTLFACDVPKAQKEFKGEQQYRTTDPSRLYFKNMRSVYYFRSRKPRSKKDIYTLKRASRDRDRPLLYPTIINNWLEDEAYIFIEKNAYPYFPEDSLHIRWQSVDSTGTFALGVPTKKAQYEFAGVLYDCLRQGHQLSFESKKGDTVSLFDRHQDRKDFLIVMRDYYKLTE